MTDPIRGWSDGGKPRVITLGASMTSNILASTPATVPITSTSRLRGQDSSSMLWASALTLAMKMSSPPSASAAAATHARSPFVSAKSTLPQGGPPISMTLTISDAGGGKYKSVTEMSAAGQPYTVEITFAVDGKDYAPVVTPASTRAS